MDVLPLPPKLGGVSSQTYEDFTFQSLFDVVKQPHLNFLSTLQMFENDILHSHPHRSVHSERREEMGGIEMRRETDDRLYHYSFGRHVGLRTGTLAMRRLGVNRRGGSGVVDEGGSDEKRFEGNGEL